MNGAELTQQMIDGGAPVGEVMQWQRSLRDQMLKGGAPPEEVGKYWGDAPPTDHAPIIEALGAHYDTLDSVQKLKAASSWDESWKAGLQWSGTGMASGKPDIRQGDDPTVVQNLAYGAGMMLGDLPANFVGGVVGAVTGGAAAGPPGAVVGGSMAGGALPVIMREALTEYYFNENGPKTWGEFVGEFGRVQWEGAKGALVGGAGGAFGRIAGETAVKIAAPVLGPATTKLVGGVTEVTAFTVAGAAADAGLRGEVPNAEDFLVGAALALGTYGAGAVIGAGAKKRFQPNQRGKEVAANLQEVYAATGLRPGEAVKAAEKDPALMAEILAPYDAAGRRITPQLDKLAPPEPKPYMPYKPEINAKNVEKELAPPVETDAPDVKERYLASVDKIDQLRKATVFLENSAGYAKRKGIPVNEVVSPAGAIGEHQIMPGTAEQYGYDPARLFEPGYNKEVATAIIADLNKRYPNDPTAVLIAYNAGPGRANKFIRSGRNFGTLPRETQDYLLRAEEAGLTDTDYSWQLAERSYNLQDTANKGFIPSNDFRPPTPTYRDWLNRGNERVVQMGTNWNDPTGSTIQKVPAPEKIAGYLQQIGEKLDFQFVVGPEAISSVLDGGPSPSVYNYRVTHPEGGPEKKGNMIRVYMPDTPDELNRRWYGLGNAEILYHEVGHAIDTIANNGRRTTSQTIVDGQLRKELEASSRKFRPKLWEMAPDHNIKPWELMADAYARWLSNPSARKEMPLFGAKYGDALKELDDIINRYMPVKTDKGWEPPPGMDAEPPKWSEPPKHADGSAGGGWVPPSGGGRIGADPDPQPRVPNNRLRRDAESLIADILDIKAPEKGMTAPDYFNPKKIIHEFDMALRPARLVDKKIKAAGLNPGPDGLSIEDLMRNTLASRERAGYFVRYGTLDPFTLERTSDKSFVSAYKAVKEDGGTQEGFEAYRLAQRTLEKLEQGIETGVNLESARAFVGMREERAKYERGSKILAAVKDASIDYAMESGRFSPGLAQAMKELNRYHIVMRRSLEPDYNPPARRARTGGPKKMKGSKLNIVDTFTADIDNLHTIIAIADYNRAVGNIIGAIEAYNAKVDATKKLPFYKRGEPAGQAMDADGFITQGEFLDGNGNPIDMTPELKKAAAFLAEQRHTMGSLKPDEFVYYREGKREIWATDDPDLAMLMRQVWPGKVNLFAQAAIQVAGLVRLGVTSALDFPLRTTILSMLSAPVVGNRTGKVPFQDIVGGVMHVFKGDEVYKDWIAKGGSGTAITDMDVNYLSRDMGRIFDETGTGNRVWNAVAHPLEMMRTLNHMMDAAARVGMFKRNIEQGTNPIKAAMLARKGYIDFAEPFQNRWVQVWSQMTAFMNSGFKDMEQFGDAVGNRKKQLVLMGAAVMTVPTIINYAMNAIADENLPDGQKYQDIPRWVRDQFWITPPINGVRVKLKKPWLPAIPFAMLPERFMDWAATNDPHFGEWMSSIMAMALPPWAPNVAAPVVEDWANKSLFTQNPLIPAHLEDASGYMQYTPDTSEASKKLTEILGPANLDLLDASPIVLDNYIRGWTGTLPLTILKTMGVPFKDPGRPSKAADIPFLGSFVYRMPTGGQRVDDFYNAYDAIVEAKADRRLMLERQDYSQFGASGDLIARSAVKAGNSRTAISNMRTVLKAIENSTMSNDEKIKQTDKIARGMVAVAKAGLVELQALDDALTKAGK